MFTPISPRTRSEKVPSPTYRILLKARACPQKWLLNCRFNLIFYASYFTTVIEMKKGCHRVSCRPNSLSRETSRETTGRFHPACQESASISFQCDPTAGSLHLFFTLWTSLFAPQVRHLRPVGAFIALRSVNVAAIVYVGGAHPGPPLSQH